MKLRLLLAILLLAVTSTSAMGRSSNNSDSLLQVQASAGDFGNENQKASELIFLLGAMAFPVLLICSYELCRSLRVRHAVSFEGFLPLPGANRLLAIGDVGIIHEVERENSALSPSNDIAWHAVGL
jgi:hypothetical protein